MNILYIRHIPLTLSILLFVPSYAIIDVPKEKIFKIIENPTIYNIGTYAIDKTATILSNIIVKFASIAHIKESSEQKKERFNKYIERINQWLNTIENNLKQEEIFTINNVYKEFEITNEEKQTINTILKQYKEVELQYLCQAHEKSVETLKNNTTHEILSLCNQLNIHPTAIELKVADSAIVTSLAISNGLAIGYQFENNNLIIDDNIVHHPAIILHPRFFEQSYEEGLATLGHELTHLALQHYSMYNILAAEIKYFTGATTENIKNSKYLKRLETIHERQAEILHKDAEWISLMRQHRHGGYYEGHLFLRHYAQLTEIDELHELKRKFQDIIAKII